MAAPTNHWKLGLFVVTGFVLTLATVALLGTRSLRKEIGRYVTYFDESVQGLEKGAPIKFRGVTIGNVGQIDVAADHRHVEVTLDLNIAVLSRLRLDVAAAPGTRGSRKKLAIATDLRVQLASAGLTGVKFLQLDFFDVDNTPLPVLPFPVPENYIPAAPSTLKSLEDAIVRVMGRVPELADQLGAILTQASSILQSLDHVVGAVSKQQLPEQLAATLATVNRTAGEAQHKVEQIDTGKLSNQAEKVLVNLDQVMNRLSSVLNDISGEKGLLTSMTRASDAVGDTARNADGASAQLEDTLVAIREAAKSIHKLADALEKDPDMLLKGRAEKKR